MVCRVYGSSKAGPNGRAVHRVGLRPLSCWGHVFESHREHGCLSDVRVVRKRSLWRANHSSRGVLPTVVRRCVWFRNLVNEETLAYCGLLRQIKKNTLKRSSSYRIRSHAEVTAQTALFDFSWRRFLLFVLFIDSTCDIKTYFVVYKYCCIVYYYHHYHHHHLLQLSFHTVAVVLTLVQTKQIIYINDTIQQHSTNSTKQSKYKYTYYQTTHTQQTNTYIHPHFTKQVKTTIAQNTNHMK